MKGMCYVVLIVAFLMFYQREPLFSVVIIGLAIGLYLFFRSRRSGMSTGRTGFFPSLLRGHDPNEENMDGLITLMMVQQLFQNSDSSARMKKKSHSQFSKREQHIEKTKKEILELFD